MNRLEKIGVGITALGLVVAGPTIFYGFRIVDGDISYFISMFSFAMAIICLGYFIHAIGERQNWEIVARHREYAFVQHKITKKRRWLYSGGSRLTEEEKRWINGETDDI